MEWRPKSPPERTCDEDGAVANSDYIDDALVFLEVTFATLTESLQPGACFSVMQRIMDECAACILKTFETGAVTSFNMFAIMQVDAEFRALEAFVSKWPGLKQGSISSELRQILDFLLSVENFLIRFVLILLYFLHEVLLLHGIQADISHRLNSYVGSNSTI